jgi:hypothetical protein
MDGAAAAEKEAAARTRAVNMFDILRIIEILSYLVVSIT